MRSSARPRTSVPGFVPWPPEVADRYRALGYWRGQTLGRLLDEAAALNGDAEAVVGPTDRWTYRELAARADRLALHLRRAGLGPGDRAVVQLPTCTASVPLLFAFAKIGVAPIMALPPHRETEIAYLTSTGGATVYVAPRELKGFDYRDLAAHVRADCGVRTVIMLGGAPDDGALSLDELLATPADGESDPAAELGELEPASSDIALFLLSGGTTGLPKLIARTHDDYVCNARVSAEVCGFDERTRYLVSLPIGHNFPLGSPGVLGTLLHGGTVVIPATPEPRELFRAIREERVTVTSLVPAMAIRWLEDPQRPDLPSLGVLQVGGARLNPEVAAQVQRALGCRVQQVFGMAEGLLNYTRLADPDEVIVQTQGRPSTPDDEVLVVDDTGRPVPDGEPGELWTRGPYTIRGYFNADEHNQRAFTPDGFYRTGDVVIRRPDGNLVVEGRVKDMINRGGEKISAEEIENLIMSHPAVSNTAVVAMADPVLGERACAYVTLRRGAALTFDELIEHLRSKRIARFKLPERLEVVDALPLTDVGKVSKAALREDIAATLSREASG